MVFSSPLFLYFFLPAALLIYALLVSSNSGKLVLPFLLLFSLTFYAWHEPWYLLLIGCSITVNYALGNWLFYARNHRKLMLWLGVGFNLLLLGVFKYTGWLAASLGNLSSFHIPVPDIVLPLAISFFTFQQIAYLCDIYHKPPLMVPSFIEYSTFVSFFPQLIAGPIVHHDELIPQLHRNRWPLAAGNIYVGCAIFAIGLFKKVVIADNMGIYADAAFSTSGPALTAGIAWGGAIAYAFQIYYDFSGYSDMAIGLARMFGICLPVNFLSPYKATSIIDFWRRWHITLSRFLRDYLYVPLGGNRKGRTRRYVNLLLTMALGGLWHGAGWNFLLWGTLHGAYLCVNHAWRTLFRGMTLPAFDPRLGRFAGWLLTMIGVVVAWVPFRASGWEQTLEFWEAMLEWRTWLLLPGWYEQPLSSLTPLWSMLGVEFVDFPEFSYWRMWMLNLLVLPVTLLFPATALLAGDYLLTADRARIEKLEPMRGPRQHLVLFPPHPALLAVLLVVALLSTGQVVEFIYFQF